MGHFRLRLCVLGEALCVLRKLSHRFKVSRLAVDDLPGSRLVNAESGKAKSLQLLERPHHSDVFRATQPGRSRGTTRERRLRSDTARSLTRRRHGSDVFGATQPGRSRRNDPGATSRSDVPSRSSQSDLPERRYELARPIRFVATS
ncbi:hypothetical protein YC2023_057765 [Brassica napus]